MPPTENNNVPNKTNNNTNNANNNANNTDNSGAGRGTAHTHACTTTSGTTAVVVRSVVGGPLTAATATLAASNNGGRADGAATAIASTATATATATTTTTATATAPPPPEAGVETGVATETSHAAMRSSAILDSAEESSARVVLVLYVGGTLGMGLNAKGALEPLKGYLTEKMHEMPELKARGMPKFEIIEYENLKDSSDMGPADWCRMAEDISANYYNYDGFLVCHGTDTMHYTAAALSFMLENLAKPVIVTGAMVPFIEPYNDARRNIIVAMMFAASDSICEVCVFCNDVLLRGSRTVKCRQSLNAFSSPNFPPLAVMGADKVALREELLQPQPTGAFSPTTRLRDANVVSLLITAGFDEREFIKFVKAFGRRTCAAAAAAAAPMITTSSGSSGACSGSSCSAAVRKASPSSSSPATATTRDGAPSSSSRPSSSSSSSSIAPQCTYVKRPLDCIIFAISGLTVDEHHTARMLKNVLQSAVDAGIVVVIANSDLIGPIRLTHVRALRELCPKAILIHDMTPETAFVKAKYLFGRGLSAEHVRRLMPVPLRGELTPAPIDLLVGKL